MASEAKAKAKAELLADVFARLLSLRQTKAGGYANNPPAASSLKEGTLWRTETDTPGRSPGRMKTS